MNWGRVLSPNSGNFYFSLQSRDILKWLHQWWRATETMWCQFFREDEGFIKEEEKALPTNDLQRYFLKAFFLPIKSQFSMIEKTWAIWFLSDYIPFLLHLVSSFTIASWQARLASVWVPRVQPARSHRGNHLRLRHPPLHCEWCWCWCWCWFWWWCWSTSNLIFTFPGDILLGNIARVQALQNFQHYCQRD